MMPHIHYCIYCIWYGSVYLYKYKIGLLLCQCHIELRLRFRLRLSWGWYWGWGYLRLRLKWGWVKVHFVCFRQFRYLFLLNFGVIFDFLGPWLATLGVGFDNCFGVYSCSWTSFIFYVSFNSNLWFWLNFVVIFDFLGL